MPDLLEALKNARETASLTQKEVEDKLGLRKLTMRDYEIGRLKLPINTAMDLATLYGTTLDQLVGFESAQQQSPNAKVLENFKALFMGNGFSVMFLDPILRAFLEDNYEKYFDRSFFDMLTEKFSEKDQRQLVLEISKFLFELASADGKVSEGELGCIVYLLDVYKMKSKYKDITQSAHDFVEIPEVFSRIEIRHFTIWLLFFFAFSDEKLSHQEINFIEKAAERLKVNKSNFLLIKEKFVKEMVA